MTSYDPKLSFELDPYQLTFIKQESAERVREAVTRLFASEGFHPSDARTYPAYQGTASSGNHRVLQVFLRPNSCTTRAKVRCTPPRSSGLLAR